MKITDKLKVMLKNILSIKMGEVETDKGRLVWDGEEDLKEGDEVFQIVDDEPQPAADGEYVTEDGKTIVVVDGKVAEIKDNEGEVASETTEETEEAPAEEVPIVESAEEELPAPADEETEEEPKEEEDRISALEEKVNAILEGLNEIINAIAGLEGRIAEVEGKLAKVEAPAADPIDEETPIEEEKKTRLSYMRKK